MSLNILESNKNKINNNVVDLIINSYKDRIIKYYSLIRFKIIPTRFLDEIIQYIPHSGNVLDIGCGFGLFTLYYAINNINTIFYGIDISEKRINIAKQSSKILNLNNVNFQILDARYINTYLFPEIDTIICLDVFHHMPFSDSNKIINSYLSKILKQNGTIVIKDIITKPRYMLFFTYLLDWIMDPHGSFYYRDKKAWIDLFSLLQYSDIQYHYLWDILPYPHFLITAKKI